MATYGAVTSDLIPADLLKTEIIDSIGMHNEQQRDFRSLLCNPTTTSEFYHVRERGIDFQELGGDTAVPDMQHVPRVEIPLNAPRRFGSQTGITQWAIKNGITSDEVRVGGAELRNADSRLVNALVLGPCFAANGWYDGTLAVAPPPYKLNTFAATHNHYDAANVAGVPAIAHWTKAKHHIMEHGPWSGLISFMNNDAVELVENKAEWGLANWDIVSPMIQELQRLGYTPSFMASGIPVIAEDWIPPDYLFVVATAPRKAEAWRVPAGPNADILDMFDDTTCPNQQYYWRLACERCGRATVIEPGAGYVYYLGGAAYVAPTSYDV